MIGALAMLGADSGQRKGAEPATVAGAGSAVAGGTASPSLNRPATPFALDDQYGERHQYAFPKSKASVLLFADKEGSKHVEGWVVQLHKQYADRVDIDGIADVSAVPTLMRGVVRFFFKRNSERPIMLDWEGAVAADYACTAAQVNVFVVSADGTIEYRHVGEATPESIADVCRAVDRLLDPAALEKTPNTAVP